MSDKLKKSKRLFLGIVIGAIAGIATVSFARPNPKEYKIPIMTRPGSFLVLIEGKSLQVQSK
jgi:hypothetical protein